MDIVVIISLLIAGLVLMLIELLLTPGFGIAGLGAIGCMAYANYFAFTHLGLLGGFVTLFVTIAIAVAALVWLVRSKSLNKLGLSKEIKSTVATPAQKQVKVGDRGISVTRLALIGNANIDGNIVEVKSCDGFLDEKCPIVVDRIEENIIMVRKDS